MPRTERYAREDTTVAGVTVARGELVFAVLASGNHDKQQFEQADTLDLAREPSDLIQGCSVIASATSVCYFQ